MCPLLGKKELGEILTESAFGLQHHLFLQADSKLAVEAAYTAPPIVYWNFQCFINTFSCEL